MLLVATVTVILVTWGSIGNEGKVIMETGVTIPLIEREKAKK